MGKEIVLYYGLHNWTAETLINALNEAEDEEVTIRVNSPGGDVWASWGLLAKIKEHGNVTIKVDGIAASMAFHMLMFAKSVECLDVSSFMAHRVAAYGSDAESMMIQDTENVKFRKHMEARISADVWKEVSGVSYDDYFSSEKRINVWLNAKQMKKLGIVNKINKLTPAEAQQIAAATNQWALAASLSDDQPTQPTPVKPTNMTTEEFKAKHPEVYASIVKMATDAERDRASAWLEYYKIDAKLAIAGAIGEKPLSQKDHSKFNVLAMSTGRLKDFAADSAEEVTTVEEPVKPVVSAEVAAQKKKDADFLASVDAILGVKPKAAAAKATV